ncbi:MAG: hypothetical protein ACXU82_12270 [Caulobacteraceae bacterium]
MKPSLIAAAMAPLLLLPACAEADRVVFNGAFAESQGRAANERQYRADVQACGTGPGAAWCRLAADDGNLDRVFPLELKPLPKGVTYAYDASQCDGTFEHGLCHGVSRPRTAQAPVCHGQTIDGLCAGPTF